MYHHDVHMSRIASHVVFLFQIHTIPFRIRMSSPCARSPSFLKKRKNTTTTSNIHQVSESSLESRTKHLLYRTCSLHVVGYKVNFAQ